MSKYIEVELTPNKFGGGSFNCKANFQLDNIVTYFQNVDVKLDTGCTLSTIPLKRLNVSTSICEMLKEQDLDSGCECIRSYGVETGGLKHIIPVTKKQKMKNKALKFKHKVEDLSIDGVSIPTQSLYVNYNRSGNVLVGMDIISLMSWHSDISLKTGKLTLISCPRDNLCDEFYIGLKEHFGLVKI